MGFFRRWESTGLGPNAVPELTVDSATSTMPPRRDYSGLGEMAAILTNGDGAAMAMGRGVSLNIDVFIARHREWLAPFVGGALEAHDQRVIAFTHWITGTSRARRYGAHVAPTDTLADILPRLERAVADLRYPLDVRGVHEPLDSPATPALHSLHDHLLVQGANLIELQTHGDGHHVFIVAREDMPRLMQLADAAGFDFTERFA